MLRARADGLIEETLLLTNLLKFPKCSKAKNLLTNDGRTDGETFVDNRHLFSAALPTTERMFGRTSDYPKDSIRWI